MAGRQINQNLMQPSRPKAGVKWSIVSVTKVKSTANRHAAILRKQGATVRVTHSADGYYTVKRTLKKSYQGGR